MCTCQLNVSFPPRLHPLRPQRQQFGGNDIDDPSILKLFNYFWSSLSEKQKHRQCHWPFIVWKKIDDGTKNSQKEKTNKTRKTKTRDMILFIHDVLSEITYWANAANENQRLLHWISFAHGEFVENIFASCKFPSSSKCRSVVDFTNTSTQKSTMSSWWTFEASLKWEHTWICWNTTTLKGWFFWANCQGGEFVR